MQILKRALSLCNRKKAQAKDLEKQLFNKLFDRVY
jgi:hypothetical protein